MGTSYREDYGGDPVNLDRRDISSGYVKDFVDAVNSRHIANRTPGKFDRQIASFTVYPSQCFIEKT